MKILLSSLLMIFVFSGCSTIGLQEKNTVWIDVRSAEEYDTGHLAAATNITHTEIGDRIAILVPDKHADIRLYCRSGRRAGWAKETLEKLGYTNVTNEGGYKDIKNKGI